MAKVLRVDMARLRVEVEEAAEDYRPLGGHALTSHIVGQEVPPQCDPLAAENRLVFAPGLLGGTAVTTSGRTSVGGKSPLTGGVKEANVGGVLGHKLARLGIKALIIQGAPPDERLYLLRIDSERATLSPVTELARLGNYETTRRLLEGSGQRRPAVMSIGPAGEMRLRGASIAVSDPEGRPTRHAARGGLGAVMGSKGLKAIVVDDATSGPPEAQDKDGFRRLVTEFSRTTLGDPRTQNMSKYGTPGVISYVNRENIASMPTRNHRLGIFAGADRISGRRIAELAPPRAGRMLPCMPGCIIKCSILFNNERKEHMTTALEFETLALLGSNLEIDELEALGRMDRLCDDTGLDTIEMGNALGVAMEAGVARFGDWERAVAMLEEVGQGTVLGRTLGNGTVATAAAYGIERVPAAKGQGLPAWESRTLKGMGISYATSPQGADHTTGIITARNVTAETLLRSSQREQALQAAIDSVGMCQFSNPTEEDMAQLLNARYGLDWTGEDILRMGRKVLREEREFNLKAGFEAKDSSYLPPFLRREPLSTSEGEMAFDIADEVVDSFWDF